MKIEEKIRKMLEGPVAETGVIIDSITLEKEDNNLYLRIVIDKKDGIDLNDCEKVNNEIKDMIDEADYIKEQYFLEISSPGIERLLRKDWQLKKYIGEEVEVKQFKKDNLGNKDYIGILKEVNEQNLKIETDEEITIDRKNIAQVKTTYKEE